MVAGKGGLTSTSSSRSCRYFVDAFLEPFESTTGEGDGAEGRRGVMLRSTCNASHVPT